MIRKLTAADYRVMPWKNGGGTTTELYAAAGDDTAFIWRVSIADVASDGPFSVFAGYDRHIMAIEGNGMMLEGGPEGPIDVSRKFVPRDFSGDWPIVSRLVSGPVRDFNLMARRDSVNGQLTCMDAAYRLHLSGESKTTYFGYLLTGGLETSDQRFAAGDSFLLLPNESMQANASANTKIALCRMKFRA